MKNQFSIFLLTLCLFMLTGCKDEKDPVAKIEPTNLAVEKTISDDGSGLVAFSASANDAVKFGFYFGEDLTAGPVNSTDGMISYTYKQSGTYKVKVLAYSVDNLFIDTTIEIVVHVDIPNGGYSTPESYDGMALVWQDEFNGDALNASDWTHETGGNWYNNELQFYQAINTTVEDGYLIINAKQESVGGRNYTSSRIITQNKKVFKYGRVDIRAILPKGQGIWPALWMLGSSITTDSWPKCGEIDIMELIGGGAGRDNKVYGTAHWENSAGRHADYGGNKTLTEPKIFADEFHVFSIVWDQAQIRWYLDDVLYHTIDITPTDLNEFQKDFFFIFNVAVGGDWPGNPNGTTIFPQRMIVDYIRVFQ